MKFSIITPTVERESLIKCVESVLSQSFTDWEMLIQVDKTNIDQAFFERISPTRKIWIEECGVCHRNGGNTCRHLAWQRATGEWCIYLDDDNYLSTPRILEMLSSLLEGVEEEWALFPIFRHGSVFFFDPPKPCYFDTGNAVVRREIAPWPDIPDYASDAVWLTETLLKHPYKAFPNAQPIMVMPMTSFGAGGGINGQ